MVSGKLLIASAAVLAGVSCARPLSDAELTHFYGYKHMAGPTRVIPPPLDANETLRAAAKRAGIYVAAAVNYGGMASGSQGPQYPVVALTQFDGFTAENECKWGPIHPQPGQYAFEQCDYLMGTGIANGSMVRFHNTAWGTENPGWLNAMTDPGQLSTALTEHINNITAHYLFNPALSYYAIDVVNEACSDSGNSVLKPVTPWYPALSDYVEVAFKAAGAASQGHSPAPLLCYNDYGAEGASYPKADKVIALVKQLQAAGAPITCVGLQMHVSVDQHPSQADISANIKQLGALGLTVHITEMDVKCPNCNSSRLQAQAQVYADTLQACLDNANCASFEMWGLYDADSWVGEENAPLLWDGQWNAKPAYYAVLSTLQQHAAKREAAAKAQASA